jgi:hypothetical protein
LFQSGKKRAGRTAQNGWKETTTRCRGNEQRHCVFLACVMLFSHNGFLATCQA